MEMKLIDLIREYRQKRDGKKVIHAMLSALQTDAAKADYLEQMLDQNKVPHNSREAAFNTLHKLLARSIPNRVERCSNEALILEKHGQTEKAKIAYRDLLYADARPLTLVEKTVRCLYELHDETNDLEALAAVLAKAATKVYVPNRSNPDSYSNEDPYKRIDYLRSASRQVIEVLVKRAESNLDYRESGRLYAKLGQPLDAFKSLVAAGDKKEALKYLHGNIFYRLEFDPSEKRHDKTLHENAFRFVLETEDYELVSSLMAELPSYLFNKKNADIAIPILEAKSDYARSVIWCESLMQKSVGEDKDSYFRKAEDALRKVGGKQLASFYERNGMYDKAIAARK